MKGSGKNLWFFGDSFCANEGNWVTKVQYHYGYEQVLHLGQAGTPPIVSIRYLLDNIDNINEDDGVVFCISEPVRPSFKRKTLPELGHDFKDKKSDMENFKLSEEEWISLKLFMKNLFTLDDWNILGHSSILFLLEQLLPSLNTNKVVYFFSFFGAPEKEINILNDGYYSIIPEYYLKYPSLHDLFYDYGMEIYNSNNTTSEKLNLNLNHWIYDGNLWDDSFFPTYKKILDKLK